MLAAAPTDRRLVLLLLRGALDGLAAAPAYADPIYASARGTLALPEPGRPNGCLDLDGRFGLHPALATAARWFARGELAVLHAVATPYRERSHVDGQDLLDAGSALPGRHVDGWVNRALGLFAGGDRLGLVVGQSVPLVARGPVPVASWTPDRLAEPDPDLLDRLRALWEPDPLLGPALARALDDRARVGALGPAGEVEQPQALRALATEIGRLLAAADGLRIAVLEVGGFDTHVNQAARLAHELAGLDAALLALEQGLGPAWRQTVVLLVTEFGRTVAPNGSGGTDHGTATVALAADGAVRGGRVLGRWPGLAPELLRERRDLAPTTDLRALLKAVLIQHLGLPRDAVERLVLPESGPVAPLPDLI